MGLLNLDARHQPWLDAAERTNGTMPLVFGTPGRRSQLSQSQPESGAHSAGGAAGLYWLAGGGAVVVMVAFISMWQLLQPAQETGAAPDELKPAVVAEEKHDEVIVAQLDPPLWTPGAELAQLDARPAQRENGTATPEILPSGANLLKDVKPIYPDAARMAGIQGVVVVTYSLDVNGRPVDLTVMKSVPGLDDAVTTALRQWQYTPPPLGSTQKYRFNAEFVLDRGGS